MSDYYYGHGEAWLGIRNSSTGVVSDWDVALPEIDQITVSLAEERIEHISKRTELAAKDLSVPRYVSATGTIVVREHSHKMLAQYLFADVQTVAGGSFNKTWPSGIVVGDIVAIPDGITHASSIVLTDSTGSPVTLTLNTHYEIVDADAGLIKFLDVTSSSVQQPFKVAGTEAAGSAVGILKASPPAVSLRFKGINLAQDDEKCVVELYRISLSPASEWTLLNDGNEVNSYSIDFELMRDNTKASNAVLGQYGFYRGV